MGIGLSHQVKQLLHCSPFCVKLSAVSFSWLIASSIDRSSSRESVRAIIGFNTLTTRSPALEETPTFAATNGLECGSPLVLGALWILGEE